MDELRWILLSVGVVAVGGVYGFTRWQEGRRNKGRTGGGGFADDADIEDALRDLDNVVVERDPLETTPDDFDVIPVSQNDRASEPVARPAPTAKPVVKPTAKPAPAAAPEVAIAEDETPVGLDEKVVVLNVAATDGRQFSGRMLAEALEGAGMHLGEHSIYHRTLDARKGRIALFSAANILRPGTFDPDKLDELHSPGVALFFQLPGPYDGLVAFEQMLETAKRIAEQLDVKLLDERRCILTNQAIEHIREELREYRRLAHLQAKKG